MSEGRPANHLDLIVIGSGPGGQRAAIQAAKLGKKVLIVEKDFIGGACLHRGTVPSKTLREAALGMDTQAPNVIEVAMERARKVIEAERSIIEIQLKRNHVQIAQGVASFVAPHKIEVTLNGKSDLFETDFVVIATGSRPFRPKDIPFNDTSIFDSDTILTLKHKPKSLAVIGAGVIGCEYASIFARLGVSVTLIDSRKSVLRSVDEEVMDILTQQFRIHAIQLELGYNLSQVRNKGSGCEVCLEDADTKVFKTQPFEAVLYCLGRTGNVKEMKLEKAGLQATPRGVIEVNNCFQTKVPHIYAVGDVQGAPALATSAAEQGRIAAASAFQHYCPKFPETFPYGIYTIPEISSAGMLETDLSSQRREYVVGRARYKELARGKILGDDHGLLKLIFDSKTEKLLGVHVIGSGATELVHIGQVALALGAGIDFFVTNVFNYPTLAEAYKVAGYNAFNQIQQRRAQEPAHKNS